MSNAFLARPRQMSQRRTFALVTSDYNPEYVQGLVDHFQAELDVIAPSASTPQYRVPGAFEIPIVVQELASKGQVDAIIAFGVVIEGATYHAELIGTSVTQALQNIALRTRIPVIHEVLVVRDEEQAKARCLGSESNRGTEAARAAVRISQVLSEIKANS